MKEETVEVTSIYLKDGSMYVTAGDNILQYYEGEQKWKLKIDYETLLSRFFKYGIRTNNL